MKEQYNYETNFNIIKNTKEHIYHVDIYDEKYYFDTC